MRDIVVYQPTAGETMRQYLQKYTDEETISMCENSQKLKEFCTILLNTKWSREKAVEEADLAYTKLWKIIKGTENYNVLLHHMQMWEPAREELLNLLSKCGKELNINSKWCTIGRIIGCSAESLSTILGFQFTESKCENCLQFATVFGGLSLFMTLAEMKISKDIFYKLMKLLERDQKLFVPIQKWYQQSEEVEKAMMNVFPFDYTSKIVKEFTDIATLNKTFDEINLLACLVTGILEQNEEKEHLQEGSTEKKNNYKEVIQKLVQFISHPASKVICEWIFLKETHPTLLDIARIVLQYYYSPLRFLVCQSVRALPLPYQSLYSAPVMGRLLLNGYSVMNDISRLRSLDVPGVHEMKNLERHLKCEWETLKRIVKILIQNDINS